MLFVDSSWELRLDELPKELGLSTVSVVLSILVASVALYLKSASQSQSPPKIPGHWLYKNRDLIQAPWRGILIAEKYKPLYGDVIQLSDRSKRRIILNSLDVISEVLEKQGNLTSDRPRNVVLIEMTGLCHSPIFRNHDEKHKKMRRIMAAGLHQAAAQSYAELHSSTSAYFLRSVAARIGDQTHVNSQEGMVVLPDGTKGSVNGQSQALTAAALDSIGKFILRVTFGYVATEDDPLLKKTAEISPLVLIHMARHFWANDFPILRYIPDWLPGTGFKRIARRICNMRTQNIAETFGPVLDKIRRGESLLPSYTSRMIELKGGKDICEEDIDLIKQTTSAMFTAGATTTIALVRSFVFAMCVHPEIAAKVRAEIDVQIGRDRIPTLHDRVVLPYTEAVLQEVIRFYPVFPLGLEHCAAEDCEVRGYIIKKGTIIEANIWQARSHTALMRDPVMYPDPNSFNPDRFLGSSPATDPRRFLFGFGRRMCPGLHVANNGTFTMCAGFMSVFDIFPSEETTKHVEACQNEPWKMFKPYGSLEPRPFGCTIKPRDSAAEAVLRSCKETAAII